MHKITFNNFIFLILLSETLFLFRTSYFSDTKAVLLYTCLSILLSLKNSLRQDCLLLRLSSLDIIIYHTVYLTDVTKHFIYLAFMGFIKILCRHIDQERRKLVLIHFKYRLYVTTTSTRPPLFLCLFYNMTTSKMKKKLKPTQPRIKPRSRDCRLSINNYVIRTLRHSLVNLMITTLWQLKSAERKWKHVATFSDLIISILMQKRNIQINVCVRLAVYLSVAWYGHMKQGFHICFRKTSLSIWKGWTTINGMSTGFTGKSLK